MVMRDLWTRWLQVKALRLSPTTLALYQGHVDVHLNPSFGDRPVASIDEDDILAYVAEKRKVLHHNTAARQLSMLRQGFEYAVSRRLIDRNPCANIHLSTRLEPVATVLDEEQVRVFLREAWRSRYYALYLVALCGGLRRAELLGLQWQDVNWKEGSLLVRETVVHLPKPSRWLTKEPKSRTSRRRVILPPEALSVLRQMYERRTSLQTRIFTHPDGRLWSARYIVGRDLPAVCRRAGLPRLRLHDLRHTIASLRLAWRHSPRAVQEFLGHSSVAFTLAVYAHVLPGDGQQAAMDIQKRLFEPPSPNLDSAQD